MKITIEIEQTAERGPDRPGIAVVERQGRLLRAAERVVALHQPRPPDSTINPWTPCWADIGEYGAEAALQELRAALRDLP